MKISLTLLILFSIILSSTAVSAEQKYNVIEGTWETVPDNSDWQPKYNVFDGNWTYQPKDAELEYNVIPVSEFKLECPITFWNIFNHWGQKKMLC